MRLLIALRGPHLIAVALICNAGQEELLIGNVRFKAFDLGGHETGAARCYSLRAGIHRRPSIMIITSGAPHVFCNDAAAAAASLVCS